MLVMFLDESGDHSLEKIDPQYPIFVLAGVILDGAYVDATLEEELAHFKEALFGSRGIILHTMEITRNRSGFERLKETGFRERFYAELSRLPDRLAFRVVACAIRKDHHTGRYGPRAIDPYLLSLEILVERFVYDLSASNAEGLIVAERRGGVLDNELELAFLNLRIKGTRYVSPSQVQRKIQGLVFRAKHENVAGLQLADLVATPIGRFVLGKPVKEDFRTIERKFRSQRGSYWGSGLVVLPK